MRRLAIGDKKLRLRDEGESARCPAVLVHGAAASSVAWMDVVRRLSSKRRVIAPDLPGHGQSDPWHEAEPGLAQLHLYRDAVGTLCAQLGIAKVVLVGHSMGGAIALLCALAWPERVVGLVLVATGARMKVAPSLFTLLEKQFDDLPEFFGRTAYSPTTPRDLVERWLAVSVQAPQEVCIADFRACDGFDVRPRLGELKMPALVIGAEDDLLTPPKLSRELGAGLANARTVVVPHAGHMLFHEQPDVFHAAIDGFFVEVP